MDTILGAPTVDGELERLRNVEREYRVTVRVLAVVAERLLAVTKAQELEVGADAMLDTPDLDAYLDPGRGVIVIKVSR